MRFTDLAPVVHQSNWDLCRVPVVREGDDYHVFVGDKFIRHYKESTLPDAIKSRLTMILASPHQVLKDDEVYKMEIYQPAEPNPEFSEIGWRASESYFCVILPQKDLVSLRGEVDTRRYTSGNHPRR